MQNPVMPGSKIRRAAGAVAVVAFAATFSATLSAQQLDRIQPAEQEPSVQQHVVTLPLIGKTLTTTKTIEHATGDVQSVTHDQDGKVVDFSELLRRETALRLSTPAAKLQPDLQAAIDAQPETAHEVVVWLVYDDAALDAEALRLSAPLGEEATAEQLEAAELQMASFAFAQMAAGNAAAVAELQRTGADIRYVSTSAPVVFVDATRAQCLAIANSRLVDTLYLESHDAKDTNGNANGTHRSTTTYSNGWRGAGMRVAVLENNGVDPACPHLNVSGWFNAGSPNPDDHVHGTSGCIASQLSTRRGGAPDVTLFSANAASYSDTNITQAGDWIAGQNIYVTNMSFGGGTSGAQTYQSRYFDYQSRTFQDSYVASAGNDGNFVGSPGLAWNCLTAGAFDDFDNTNWSGDAMASFSDFRNPTSGCEKPNLAAVGVSVDTIGMAPDWLRDNYSGTSFSAPFTTAAVAVTISRDSSASSPEAAMAALMCTAWHNIEGSTRLSDLDGAGGLHQLAAANCGNANRIRVVTLTSGSFSNNGYYTYNITLNGGDRARIAIGWSASANSSYTSSVLQADLDIAIIAGSSQTSGTVLASSSSFNNNFEIVDFTPASTGTYTIRINDYRFDGSSERVGIAWTQLSLDSGN